MKLVALVVCLWLTRAPSSSSFGYLARKLGCPCHSEYHCTPVSRSQTKGQEAIVMSEGENTWKKWDWKTITSVVSITENSVDLPLMCYAHSKGARYGFTAKVTSKNLTSNFINSWLVNIAQLMESSKAELVVLDMLDLMDQANIQNSSQLVNLTKQVKASVKSENPSTELVCLVPWKPPCFGSDCDYEFRVLGICDLFMLTPESFVMAKDFQCKAHATIPFTKIHLGIDEHLSHGLTPDLLIISIPWHGYDYKCDNFYIDTVRDLDICFLQKNSKSKRCEYLQSRVKLPLSTILARYKDEYTTNHTWHPFFMAPFFSLKNKTTQRYHQVWYENMQSLKLKYEYVREMNFRGLAVWTGDDLHNTGNVWFDGFASSMWSWVLHSVFMYGDFHSGHENLQYLPKAMAIVGISCVIVGGLLGFGFGWAVCRKRGKKRLKPFQKDSDFTDDDQAL